MKILLFISTIFITLALYAYGADSGSLYYDCDVSSVKLLKLAYNENYEVKLSCPEGKRRFSMSFGFIKGSKSFEELEKVVSKLKKGAKVFIVAYGYKVFMGPYYETHTTISEMKVAGQTLHFGGRYGSYLDFNETGLAGLSEE